LLGIFQGIEERFLGLCVQAGKQVLETMMEGSTENAAVASHLLGDMIGLSGLSALEFPRAVRVGFHLFVSGSLIVSGVCV
jgi:hypothetical protein